MSSEDRLGRLLRLANIALLRRRLIAQQLAVVDDTSTNIIVQCPRRSGKTDFAISDFLIDGLNHPGMKYVYTALRKKHAQEIVWRDLELMCSLFCPSATLSKYYLTCTLPNGSQLSLYGLDREDLGKCIHGLKLRRLYLDEAAFYTRINLGDFIPNVVEPTLADHNGKVIMMSRPGDAMFGFFHDVIFKKENAHLGWSLHQWSWADNPAIRDRVQALINKKLKSNPNFLELATTRRNYFNEWVSDVGDLVYKFNPDYNILEDKIDYSDYQHVAGIDIGYKHFTSVVVGAFQAGGDKLIYRECFKKRGMPLNEIAAKLKEITNKYDKIKMVGDYAARTEFATLRQHYRLPIMDAKKSDKRFFIELMNSALSEGRILVDNADGACNGLIKEWTQLHWVMSRRGVAEEGTGEVENDASDSANYVFRYAFHKAFIDYEQDSDVMPSPSKEDPFEQMLYEREMKKRNKSDNFLANESSGGDARTGDNWLVSEKSVI